MTDDIVARLRIAWEAMGEMGNGERAEAAAEIERLRGMLEVQDEMVKHYVEERDEARRWLCVAYATRQSSAPKSVRDIPAEAKEFAAMHGWDCFKEKP
jgi:hypothetical protein